MRRMGIAVFCMCVGSCDAPPEEMQPGPLGVVIANEAEFEAARQDAARLISGTVADWRSAREETKVVYAMISAASLRPGAQRDGRAVSVFKTCMDASASQANPDALLSDLSYDCSQVLQRNGI